MKLNGIEITHLPVTLRNERVCKEWYVRVKEHIQKRSVEHTLRNIARLRNEYEDLAELIDEVGMINQRTVLIRSMHVKEAHQAEHDWQNELRRERKESEHEYEPLTPEAAKGIAEKELQDSLTMLLQDNPEIGRELYFNVEAFPKTMESLVLGIHCIRATCDRGKLSEEQIASIDSNNESEFWQDVSASEVAAYVDKFCSEHRQ
jgi:hypothetical protein